MSSATVWAKWTFIFLRTVTGILEAYWEAYEAVGLNVFAGGYEYLQEVWRYHQEMVEAICKGNDKAGYEALVAHTDLLYHRS